MNPSGEIGGGGWRWRRVNPTDSILGATADGFFTVMAGTGDKKRKVDDKKDAKGKKAKPGPKKK